MVSVAPKALVYEKSYLIGEKSAAIAPNAQKSQTALISAVLEYVQGMGIVKSFNLSGRGDKRIQDALEYNRKSSLDMEKLMRPYTICAI
jgi:ATP-binding cassette subfamily B protein